MDCKSRVSSFRRFSFLRHLFDAFDDSKDPNGPNVNTYIETIMTNDCEANYWGVNGTNVSDMVSRYVASSLCLSLQIELQSVPEKFRFIPV
jgi:hypothetical protein